MTTLTQGIDSDERARLVKTAAYCAAFIALGLTHSSLGPTLTDLARHTGTVLAEISFVFTTRALGYLMGSFFGGRLYDRMKGHPLMGGVLVAVTVFMGVTPLLSGLWALVAVLFLLGMVEGVVDVGGNTLLVWVHGDGVAPYMNALHFFFGVGAFLSPIVVARALALTGDIVWAYWVLALLVLPVAAVLLCLPSPPAPTRGADASEAGEGVVRGAPLLVAFVAVFFFLYVGAEGSFGGWIATYAQVMDLGTAETAAYLTSAFWGALMVGRLLSIPLTARFRPRQVLTVDLIGCLLSVGLVMLWPSVAWVVWAGTFGAGLFMASIFPTMISLAGRRMTITGKITAWFFVGGSLGGMTLPWVIGQLFATVGPWVVILAIFVSAAAAALVFAGLLAVFRQPLSAEGAEGAEKL